MSSPNFQSILDALDDYTKQTGINLKDDPFADKVKGCDSPGAILRLLEENVKAFKEYRDKNRKFIDCLSPVVQFVHSFSGILGEVAGLVSREPSFSIYFLLISFSTRFRSNRPISSSSALMFSSPCVISLSSCP
jgi:hypothetical protein